MGSETPLDEVFRTLADVHRRRLLVTLLEHDSPKVDDVCVPEDGRAGRKEPERLYVRMFHVHLPYLENAGFIRWEEGADTVEKGPQFEEIRPLLELMDAHVDELPASWM